MDYIRPIEALIPGVQGRVLGVLSRTEMEMTIRTVAGLAGVSPQQASVVVAHLVDLGIVARREAGSSALVHLELENEAARLLLALARLHESAMVRLSQAAQDIDPRPASLTVFGSFSRREAVVSSDLDVLAVRPEDVAADDDDWVDSLGRWEVAARKIVGNPVNVLVVSPQQLPALLRRRSGPWHAIAKEGLPLIGALISTPASVA